jgi:hypothetical protein
MRIIATQLTPDEMRVLAEFYGTGGGAQMAGRRGWLETAGVSRNIDWRIAMRIPIAFALALGAVVFLGQSAAQPPEKKVLSLEAARKMAAAIGEAERNHWRGVVAVVDDGGWLILLERMDRAAMTARLVVGALALNSQAPTSLCFRPRPRIYRSGSACRSPST